MSNYLPELGMAIFESDRLTVPDGEEQIKRTWHERLFTIPWHPFERYKYMPRFKPDDNVYIVPTMTGDRFIMCHPVIAEQLRNQIIAENLKLSIEMAEREDELQSSSGREGRV